MKVSLFYVFLLGAFSGSLSLPTSKNINDEVEIVPLERHNPYEEQPIVDTDVSFGGPFSSNPFGGLFDNLEGIMTRMRQQMETLLKRFPIGGGNSSGQLPDFPVFGGDLPAPFPVGDIDLSKGNSTSVTKVIDGHTVVINETEYKKEDDFGGAYFKVRIIDVKPDSSEVTTEKDAEEVSSTPLSKIRDTEQLENSAENEISKSKEAPTVYENLETFDEVDQAQPENQVSVLNDGNSEWNDLATVEALDDNSLNFGKSQPPFDLSGDTYINEILEKSGAPANPDAEFFVPRQPQGQFLNSR